MIDQKPHVAILMCTYNGEKFLQEQLDSLIAQSHQNWSLWVSDDGSSDQTLQILAAFKSTNPGKRIVVKNGPKKGFCANFLSLMCHEEIRADYYALSDQDDIWQPEKLTRAITKLVSTGASLYGGRTISVDEEGSKTGISPLFIKPPSFKNALVQSIMGGNTLVLNQLGIDIVRKTGVVDVQSHDWWIYILMTAYGKNVFYDQEPWLLYRQHGSNLVGSNTGIGAKLNRIKRLFRNEFKEWNGRHVEALRPLVLDFENDCRYDFEKFCELRSKSGLGAIALYSELRLYRQTPSGKIALLIATLFGKL